MIRYMSEVIRENIAQHVRSGRVTDVYRLALELHSKYGLLTEDDYAALISRITTEVKGAAVLWERHG